jgi:hypothetical protein
MWQQWVRTTFVTAGLVTAIAAAAATPPAASHPAPAAGHAKHSTGKAGYPQVWIDESARVFHEPNCKVITSAMRRRGRSVAKIQKYTPAKECSVTDAEATKRWDAYLADDVVVGRQFGYGNADGGTTAAEDQAATDDDRDTRGAGSSSSAAKAWGKLESDQKSRDAEYQKKLGMTVYESSVYAPMGEAMYHTFGCEGLYRTERLESGSTYQKYVGRPITLKHAMDERLVRHGECNPPSYEFTYQQ